ncbi:MAG: glycosyltransferase [Anaerolineae bacterium]
MHLSVIIPNLHSPIINQTLDAIAGQTWPLTHTEVIVVGLDRYGHVARYPFARHIDTGDPVSPACARNMGVRAARGDILVFLDADGIPRPDWLARVAAWFEEPDVAVVGGAVGVDWDEPYWTACDNAGMVYQFLPSAPAGERLHLTSFNLAVRRCVLERVGLFDETFPRPAGEDTELTTRLRLAGHTLFFDPYLVATHRQSRGSCRAAMRKAWTLGYYSARVDRRYARHLGFPTLLLNPWALRLAAPLLAAAITWRILAQVPQVRRRALWCGIYLAKLAWCWGAADRLDAEAAPHRRPDPPIASAALPGGAGR